MPAIEIDDVKPLRARIEPALGHFQRLAADGVVVIGASLFQTNGLCLLRMSTAG